MAPQLCVVVKGIGRPHQLFLVLAPRFALLQREQPDQMLLMVAQLGGRGVQQLGAVVGHGGTPLRRCGHGRRNCSAGIGSSAAWHCVQHFLSGRVVHGNLLRSLALRKAAVDVHQAHGLPLIGASAMPETTGRG